MKEAIWKGWKIHYLLVDRGIDEGVKWKAYQRVKEARQKGSQVYKLQVDNSIEEDVKGRVHWRVKEAVLKGWKIYQLLVDKGVDEGVKWKVLQRVIRGKTERFINVPATSWPKHWRRCERKGSLEGERGNVESLEKSTYF